VRIDHHDMALRGQFADPVENERGCRRFAGAGRAEQREVLAQHRIDIERPANIACRIDSADFDDRAVIGRVELAHIVR
jgi:hypothetical protein